MKSIRWLAGAVVFVAATHEAPAQYILPSGGGLSLDYRRYTKNSALAVTVKRPQGYLVGPVYGPGLYPPPYGNYRQIVVVQQAPQIFVPPPFLFPPKPPDFEPPPRPRLRAEVPEEEPFEVPLPGREAGKFRPLDPDNRDRAKRPVLPPPPRREERVPLPPERQLPPPPLRLDPIAESTRQLDLGREAFARGEYGRAAERFRQAVDLRPANPQAHLLLGQAHIAIGNYRRAFDALQTGLRLEPDWPRQPFRPGELYGDNVVDFAEHVRLLEDLLEATPDDPVLLFVAGYQLWFNGRREEARDLLLKAAPALADPDVVERFLLALPPRADV